MIHLSESPHATFLRAPLLSGRGAHLCAALVACCVWACGTEPTGGGAADGTAVDGNTTDGITALDMAADGTTGTEDVTLSDGDGADATPDDGTEGDAAPDDGQVGDDGTADSGVGADGVAGDTLPGDTAPDVKVTDFHVVSTDPADGAMGVGNPIQFTVTFNDKVKEVVIGPNTVQVVVNGAVVDGSWSVSGNSFTFASAAPVLAASRVDVTMAPIVQSEIGYTLSNQTSFKFYVQGLDAMAPYAKLARRYAPTLRQAVASGNDKYDRLGAADFDGNQKLGDNGSNVGKFPALGQVGWSVVESQSHWFITYTYFWPHRTQANAAVAFDNDSAGSTVVVAKYPAEHPVALTTWFKQKSAESMWMWVTAESGLPKTSYVRGVYSESQLFPDTADGWGCEGIVGCKTKRFPGFLTASIHQSCLWLDAGDSASLGCVNNPSTQAQLKWVDYAPGVTPTEPAIAASPGPKATYALYATFDQWWPHRQDVGAAGWFVDTAFAYEPPQGRPAGVVVALGSKFYNVDNDFSRPPWAWRWTKDAAGWYDMPAGTPFLDPAYALAKRLLDVKNPMPGFDATKKTGWSQDYCLEPFLYIDARTSAPCLGSTPE